MYILLDCNHNNKNILLINIQNIQREGKNGRTHMHTHTEEN